MSVEITFHIPARSSLEPVKYMVISVSPAPISDRRKTGERPGEKASPVDFCALPIGEGRGPGKKAPGGSGGRLNFPPATPSPSPPLWARGAKAPDWGTELEEVMEVISELSARKRNIEDILAKPNAADEVSKRGVRKSHGGDPEMVVALDFSLAAKSERVGKYNQLAASAFQFGPLREERRKLMSRIKTLDKSATALRKQIEKKRRSENVNG